MAQTNDAVRMNSAHVRGKGLADRVGGEFGKVMKQNGYETCASQLSFALNHSGFPINGVGAHLRPDWINPHPKKGEAKGQPRTLLGGDGMLYIFSVIDMIVYLDGKFGKSENIKGTAQSMEKAVTGRTGIIAYGFRHIDLWLPYYGTGANAGKLVYRSNFYTLFSDPSSILRGIFFWKFADRNYKENELDPLLYEGA